MHDQPMRGATVLRRAKPIHAMITINDVLSGGRVWVGDCPACSRVSQSVHPVRWLVGLTILADRRR